MRRSEIEGKYCTDNETAIDADSIPIPALCKSCTRNQKGEIACNLTRIDQADAIRNGGVFCCFAYEHSDPNIDEDTIFRNMKNYLEKRR
jgi:hypothetical protein